MSKNGKNKASDWRDLLSGPNKRKSKSVSWKASARLFFGKLFFVAVAVAVCAGVCGVVYLCKNAFFDDIFGVGSNPVRRIEFKTDGVITPQWIRDYIKLPKKTKLSDVNIFAVKSALEGLSQVKTAKVDRAYPDKIRITITERRPVARAQTEIDMRTVEYAISPEGVFYEPVCLNPKYYKSLPLITGYRLRFDGRTPADLKCIKQLMEFLAFSQAKMPMQKWAEIDVKDIDSVVKLIAATTDDGVKIIFAPQDYPKQFDRLEYVLRYSKENKLRDIKQIDLSLRERADVKLRTKK